MQTKLKYSLLALWRWLHSVVPSRLQQPMDRLERRYDMWKLKREGTPKLNLGCGNFFRWGYVNIDKYNSRADEMADVCDLHRYRDNSVAEVLAEHLIEHLPRRMVPQALREWYRVLKSGGRLILHCPNFELYLREWLEADTDYRRGWGIINIFGHDEEGMYHKNGLTVDILRALVEEAGFQVTEIKITENRFARDSLEYRKNGDIYSEAIKPIS